MAAFELDKLDDWVTQTQERMEAVFKTAALYLAEEIVIPKAKGGRMPVDFGFLRNSISAAVNSVPRGLSERPVNYLATDFDAVPLALAANRAKIGDEIVFGFTASYAPVQEAKNGFVRLAAQNWAKIVDKAVAKVKREVNG